MTLFPPLPHAFCSSFICSREVRFEIQRLTDQAHEGREKHFRSRAQRAAIARICSTVDAQYATFSILLGRGAITGGPVFLSPQYIFAHQTCRKWSSRHSKGTTVLFDSVLDVNSTRRWLELHGLKPSLAAFEHCLDNSAQTKFPIPQVKYQE